MAAKTHATVDPAKLPCPLPAGMRPLSGRDADTLLDIAVAHQLYRSVTLEGPFTDPDLARGWLYVVTTSDDQDIDIAVVGRDGLLVNLDGFALFGAPAAPAP